LGVITGTAVMVEFILDTTGITGTVLFPYLGAPIGTMVGVGPVLYETVQSFGQSVTVTHSLLVAVYVTLFKTQEVGLGQKVLNAVTTWVVQTTSTVLEMGVVAFMTGRRVWLAASTEAMRLVRSTIGVMGYILIVFN
jgi:hypothetical protein